MGASQVLPYTIGGGGRDSLAMLLWGGDTTSFKAVLLLESDCLAVLKGVGDVQSFYHFTWGGGGDKELYCLKGYRCKQFLTCYFPIL